MNTIRQIYENAGTLMRIDKTYEKVREDIEILVMEKRMYKWNDEATKEFIDNILTQE